VRGEPVFTGVGVALVTLFDDHGEVDAPATAHLAARLADRGVRAVVPAGSTGEAAALSGDERTALVREIRARIPDEVPVIAGTGAASAAQAATLTRAAIDAGADAVLVLSPPRSADPGPYYEAVREAAGDTPVLAYHFPGVSPPGIPVSHLPKLPVDGIKDSSGDADRLLELAVGYERPVYVGSSALLVQAGAIGCAGAILAAANVEPETAAAAFGGDGHAQRHLFEAHRAVSDRFPKGLKEALAERFGVSARSRMG
jgi:4-hydroxy-tetrahydrodipicolinate synthase